MGFKPEAKAGEGGTPRPGKGGLRSPEEPEGGSGTGTPASGSGTSAASEESTPLASSEGAAESATAVASQRHISGG